MNKGKLYGVGVGPGEKELLTLKAARILKEADMIASPRTAKGGRAAYDIASEYIDENKLVEYTMPMTKNISELEENYRKIADDIEQYLKKGLNVAFITLGDVTVYSTYMQVDSIIKERGYETELIPGITSFCAAAAKLGMPLCERDEPLVIMPASYNIDEGLMRLPGTKVFMKAGRDAVSLCERLRGEGELENIVMVENCGMDNERIRYNIDIKELEENRPSYFTVFITKQK